MYKKPPKKVELLKRTATYSAMSLAVVAIATVLVFFLLGYRRDWSSGQIAQSGLLQFDSTPSGADVSIDGRSLGSSTPTKTNLLPGGHNVTIYRSGYKTWSKSVDVQSGTLLWLDYVRLVPDNITPEVVKNYSSVTTALPSPDGKKYLLQLSTTSTSFELVDISGDKPSFSQISLPTSITSKLTADKMTTLVPVAWDNGSRYLTIKASGTSSIQWLVVDSKQPEKTKNVTTTFNIDISSLEFFGTSGNILYGLSGSDLRKFDLSNGTISRSLISGVSSFSIYDDRVLSFQGTKQSGGVNLNVVGIYRDGDESPVTIKEAVASEASLAIAITTFHSDDFVAVLENKVVSVYHGSFPPSGSSVSDHLKAYDSFLVGPGSNIGFSPKAEYLLVNNGENYKTFDIEYKTLSEFTLSGSKWKSNTFWLDIAHLYSNVGGVVTMRDYDGSNGFLLFSKASNLQIALTNSGKYIYSLRPTASGEMQLVRVKMII